MKRTLSVLIILFSLLPAAEIQGLVGASLGMAFLGENVSDYTERRKLQRIDTPTGALFQFDAGILFTSRLAVLGGFGSRGKGTRYSIVNAAGLQKRESLSYFPAYGALRFYLKPFSRPVHSMNFAVEGIAGAGWLNRNTAVIDYNYNSNAAYLLAPKHFTERHLLFAFAVEFNYRTARQAVLFLRFQENFLTGDTPSWGEGIIGVTAHVTFLKTPPKNRRAEKFKTQQEAAEIPAGTNQQTNPVNPAVPPSADSDPSEKTLPPAVPAEKSVMPPEKKTPIR